MSGTATSAATTGGSSSGAATGGSSMAQSSGAPGTVGSGAQTSGSAGAGTQSGSQGTPGGQGAGATAAGPQGLTTEWTSGLNDDFKGYVQNKGWKDPSQVVESYRNAEKLLGAPQDQIIRLPQGDDPSAWESIHTRLGRPATPEGYGIAPADKGADPTFAKNASEWFYKAGLSEKQGKQVAEAWNEFQKSQVDSSRTDYAAKIAVEKASLQKEWGMANEQNTRIAQAAAREFQVPDKAIEALEKAIGFPQVMKLFHSIGAKLGEASFVTGNTAGGDRQLTPDQGRAMRQQLMGDPAWVKRYNEGGAKERSEMARLNHFIAGD